MMIKHEKERLELTPGASGKDLSEKLNQREPHQSLALMLNGTLVDLSHEIKEGDEANLISFDSKEGKEVFWHSSSHILG